MSNMYSETVLKKQPDIHRQILKIEKWKINLVLFSSWYFLSIKEKKNVAREKRSLFLPSILWH